ncbi:MAG: virulence factor SrfC family protein [Pseudomonadota bacterium]|nr:virulence factor SrfC family protein [Pseudomonadota bacterium]
MRGDIRPKDAELAELCRQATIAAGEAVEWLSDNRDPTARIQSLQKSMRRNAVEARRLAMAAERPMSVGVFGASQAGKSFLIGKLITPPGRSVKVVFGEGEDATRQDFLRDVNPEGGDETTGLVTRFSIHAPKTPQGFPVVLRLLREIDIAKILANSFRFDLKGQYKIASGPADETPQDRSPTSERIAELEDRLSARAGTKPLPGFSVEDIYELRDYVEKHLDDHRLADEAFEGYWLFLERALPYLDAAGRAEALGPLWAELDEFGTLFKTLKLALDKLQHPTRIFTRLSALQNRSKGVLHVTTLYDLDMDGATETLQVTTQDGPAVELPMCVVTALTAELQVRLEEAPWDFFTHTDLLDFPGARSRENKTVGEYLRNPSEHHAPRAHCFLRGKVAVLFDNYAADLDLNAMLLCVGPENQEVKSLPGLVREWVTQTHGDTPERRQGREPALFLCLTKSDMLFGRKVGGENPVQKRLENNLAPYGWWADEWVPGRAFDNMFFIRNPGIENRGLFTYEEAATTGAEVQPETGLTAEFQAELDGGFRQKFLGEPLVQRHVRKSEERLDAVLAINDGGTSLLARALAPVCNPDLKHAQVAPRAERVLARIGDGLETFYESDDIQKRVTERVERATRLIRALRARRDDIGPFIAALHVDERIIEAAYIDYRRQAVRSEPAADDFEALFGEAGSQEAQPTSRDGVGRAIVSRWADHLVERTDYAGWAERLGVVEDEVRAIVTELTVGAERLGVDRMLEAKLDEFTLHSLHLNAAASRVAIHGALVLNDQVNHPGGRNEPANANRFQRGHVLAVGETCDLPEETNQLKQNRLRYAFEWSEAVKDLARDNASWSDGAAVDVEQNARLGKILDRVGRRPQ